MTKTKENRERIKELVKQVLDGVSSKKKSSEVKSVYASADVSYDKAYEFDRDESAKSLLTEDDFRGLENGAKIRVAEGAKLTPLASDIVKDKNLELIRKQSRGDSLKVESVGVGCDHGGYEVKERLRKYLKGLGLLVRDFGTSSKEAVDYPDFAHAVAHAVSEGKIDVGIVIDGAGIGSAMAAGKVPNVRPAACYSVALARNSRQHNGANVLSLGSGQNSFEEIKEIVHAFLTNEITEPRHKKRVGKIDAIERQYKNREQ